VKSLHAKIGELRRSAHQGRFAERKAKIDRAHDLPIAKQAEALNISRGSVYNLPRPVSETDLAIMRRIDRLHLECPFAGSRMLRGLLAGEGCKIGRRHVKTLMRRMGIEALYRRPALPRYGRTASDGQSNRRWSWLDTPVSSHSFYASTNRLSSHSQLWYEATRLGLLVIAPNLALGAHRTGGFSLQRR
jgi:hypothetical protein